MAGKTATVNARIEPESKEKAEKILSTLGISVSNAINIFYKQIILHNGMPFEMTLPVESPVDMSKLSNEELKKELEKGYECYETGHMKVAEQAFEEIRKNYK